MQSPSPAAAERAPTRVAIRHAPWLAHVFYYASIYRFLTLFAITVLAWVDSSDAASAAHLDHVQMLSGVMVAECVSFVLLNKRHAAGYWYGVITSGLWLIPATGLMLGKPVIDRDMVLIHGFSLCTFVMFLAGCRPAAYRWFVGNGPFGTTRSAVSGDTVTGATLQRAPGARRMPAYRAYAELDDTRLMLQATWRWSLFLGAALFTLAGLLLVADQVMQGTVTSHGFSYSRHDDPRQFWIHALSMLLPFVVSLAFAMHRWQRLRGMRARTRTLAR